MLSLEESYNYACTTVTLGHECNHLLSELLSVDLTVMLSRLLQLITLYKTATVLAYRYVSTYSDRIQFLKYHQNRSDMRYHGSSWLITVIPAWRSVLPFSCCKTCWRDVNCTTVYLFDITLVYSDMSSLCTAIPVLFGPLRHCYCG